MRASRLLLSALTCAALLGPAAAFAQTAAPAPAAPAAAAPSTAMPAAPAPTMKGMKGMSGMPSMVNINTASVAELDKLPRIGPKRGARIVKNRPYTSTDELLSKKVLPKSVYDRIKSMVTTG
jgi:DNA uptake protein ComE-like DNA-binding protein